MLSRMELMCGNGDNAGRKFGRGVCLSVPVKEGSAERFVIRDYRHGGLLGKLLGGVFCDGNRPLNEVCINEIALRKGVPSAEVIAITKKKLCGLFYRANFITGKSPAPLTCFNSFRKPLWNPSNGQNTR